MSASAEKAAEELQAILASISKKDLVDELAKRDGVDEYSVHIGQRYHVEVFSGDTGNRPEATIAGPAHILVVID